MACRRHPLGGTSRRADPPLAALTRRHGWKRLIKRPVYSLVKPLYQLMMVEDGLVQPADREQWKRMMATEVHR